MITLEDYADAICFMALMASILALFHMVIP